MYGKVLTQKLPTNKVLMVLTNEGFELATAI